MEEFEIEPIEKGLKSPIKRFIDKYWKMAFTALIIFMLIFWFFRI